MLSSTLIRRLLAGAAVLVLVGLVVGGLGRVRLETSLQSFLPVDDPDLAAYDTHGEEFGADPVVVLLEDPDGELLSPDRLEQMLKLEGRLSQLSDVTGVYGPATLLNQIAGRAQDLVAELIGRRDAEVARAEAQARESGDSRTEVTGAGVAARNGFDARYGPLLVSGLPGGLPTLRNARFVEQVVFSEGGATRGQWRFVVPSRTSAAILVRPDARLSAEQSADLANAVRRVVAEDAPADVDVTVTGAPVLVSALSAKTVDDAARLGLIAVGAVGLCFLSAVYIRRSRRLAPLATTLVAVAGAVAVVGWSGRPVSLGVIAFCSVLLGIGCYYPTYFALGARPRTVLVVAAATAASLATLALSPLPLVRDLGTTMAIGVVLAALVSVPVRGWLGLGTSTDVAAFVPPTRRPPARQVRTTRLALGLAAVVGVVGWTLLPSIPVESDVEHFAGGLPELADAEHVEDVLGSSGEVDIVLTGPDTLTPEALTWMEDVSDVVATEHGGSMRQVLSPPLLLDFLGGGASLVQVDAAMRLLPEYLSSAVVTQDRTTAVMSFGVRLDELGTLRATIDDVEGRIPPPPVGYEARTVGLPVVLLRGEELVSSDRVLSNLLGVVAAGAVLLLGLRRRSDGLRAILAAGIATGVSFFLIHTIGISLNPVTVALGALTTAVGCEFTVVQAEAARTGSRTLGRAVGLVALTSAVGYLALLGSGLEAVRGFGLLLAAAVGIAVAASWLVVRSTVTVPDPPAPAPDPPATANDSHREVAHV